MSKQTELFQQFKMEYLRILMYFAALVACFLNSVSIVTAQLLGQFLPRLQLNLIRFTSQLILVIILAMFLRKNVFYFKTWFHAPIAVFDGVMYCIMILSINVSTLYAPVGNLESVGIFTFVLPAVIFNIVQRRASWSVVGFVMHWSDAASPTGIPLR